VGAFGDKFRKERERQGIKLEDVSNSTKIGSRMLRAIEDEHFDQLPGGVFNKGFIRAYAKHLGIDEEEAVAGYLAAMNPGQGLVAPSSATDRRPGQAERRHGARRLGEVSRNSAADSKGDELPELQLPKAEHVRPRRKLAVYGDSGIGWRIPVLLALLMIAGAIWWTHSRSARTRSVSSASAAVPLPAATFAPPSAGPIGNNNAAKPSVAAVSHASSPAQAQTGTPTAVKPASHAALPTSSPQTVAAVKASSHAAIAPPEENTDEATAAAPKTRANLTLVIRAQENSWIAVTADGQPVIRETLIAPAHASIRAAKEIVVRAGNSAGITFSLNGEEFSPPGSEGEVKTFMFDAAGMHETISAPSADPAH
jgi:cytoskeleton protein RodZ